MVMEYLPGGDLMGLLIKEGIFSEGVTLAYMRELVAAIGVVHKLGFIHRDLKPDNILLDHMGHIKLTDLGLCKRLEVIDATEDLPSPSLHHSTTQSGNWHVSGKGIRGPVQVNGGGKSVASKVAFGHSVVKSGGFTPPPASGSGPPITTSASSAAPAPLSTTPMNNRNSARLQCFRIDEEETESGSVGGDIGIPNQTPVSRRELAYSRVGTPDYMAPEVLKGDIGYGKTTLSFFHANFVTNTNLTLQLQEWVAIGGP